MNARREKFFRPRRTHSTTRGEKISSNAAVAQYFNAYVLRDTKMPQIREETPILEEDVLGSTATYKIGVSTK
jgi:hypothetical protein